jgi:hypothetical protein
LRGRYEQSSAAGCGMSASSSMDFQRMMLLGRRSTSSTPPPPDFQLEDKLFAHDSTTGITFGRRRTRRG